jgi:uncharacterized protein (TIGR03382 family)
MRCDAADGEVPAETDCNDASAAVYPGATEYCNNIDDNCDGAVDEAGAADGTTWFVDADGDGFGDPTASSRACVPPDGTVQVGTDCDDTDPDVHPGATDGRFDTKDQDCSGEPKALCGCAGPGAPTGGGAILLGVLILRRRKLTPPTG